MGFSLFYLLFGLPLLGIPVLLHLLTRKKPVQLSFPALRFLRARHQIRQRHRRVRHWLLLALRIFLLLIICCALIPPLRCDSDSARGDVPAAAAVVLLFDTSASMEYSPGDRTRLDLALFHARAVLDTLPPDCRVALIDSADPPGVQDNADRFTSPVNARALLEGIRIRPANAPLNGVVQRASRLLRQGTATDAGGGVIYVFSDGTRGSWDGAQPMPPLPTDVRAVFVDVGVPEPLDLSIDQVEVIPPLTAPGEKGEVRVRVRATGGDLESDLFCQFKEDPSRPADRQAVRLARGAEAMYIFPFKVPEIPNDGPAALPRQVTVRLATADNLGFNNIRYATYLVRRPRRVLALAEAPPPGRSSPAELLKAALEAVAVEQPVEAFRCDVRSVAEPILKAEDLLQSYAVVCLFEVAHPSPALWDTLKAYVQKGGGLLLVPGGDEILPTLAEVNRGAEVGLAPARLISLMTSPAPGLGWARFDQHAHPLTANMRSWLEIGDPDFNRDGRRPAVGRSWNVGLEEGAKVVAEYTDKRPALLERSIGQGRVVMLTSPLTGRRLEADRPWHNYWNRSSFGLVLVDQVCRFLDGTRMVDIPGPVNDLCESGRLATLPAPIGSVPPYTLSGPGLSQARQTVANADPKGRLLFPQAMVPGNYTLQDSGNRVVAGFSLNVPAQESRLERVPDEELEAALGKGSVVRADRTMPITAHHDPSRIDPLPWLLLALVVAVVCEAVFANRFSRPPGSPDPRTATQTWITRASRGGLAGLAAGAMAGGLIGGIWAVLSASGVFDTATRYALTGCLVGAVMGGGISVFGTRRLREMRLKRSFIVGPEEDSKWSSTPSIHS